MYAAAGGASLASRQARQKNRLNKQAAAKKIHKDLIPKPPRPGQYHNYTDDEIVPSRLPAQNALKPPQQHHDRRHSTSYHNLKEPRARIRESPSICIPVQNHLGRKESHQGLEHCPLVHNHLPARSPSLTSHLPQILIPEDGDKTLERRCSFVRQVEEMEKFPEGGTGVLDRCNHMCNFEIKDKGWENNPAFYADYDRSLFGSLDYPFSERDFNRWMSTAASAGMQAALLIREKQRHRKKNLRRGKYDLPSHVATKEIAPFPQYPPANPCSQGRTAWQERERGRRCSLSEEARQHRLKQSEAHHRWMKRNRIHDTTYGGSSEEEDFFDVYHQSAAANALLYVGLGTTAIGSVIFFVGTGEKGFKTLELRMIGPTLIACGLLCCLIRVLLCACPSNCLRKRKKTRLKNVCPHSSSRYPLTRDRSAHRRTEMVPHEKHKKKVSIVTGNQSNPIPSTSTGNFQEEHVDLVQSELRIGRGPIPIITVPDDDSFLQLNERRLAREDSLIELENLDINYELQSISSFESETVIEVECEKRSKHTRSREPVNTGERKVTDVGDQIETSLSVVLERLADEPECTNSQIKRDEHDNKRETHSGIVLSPSQLGQ